ncbi:MAG: MBL fold metallo-hydrolase [Candidatus Hodarchaeales archaeon]
MDSLDLKTIKVDLIGGSGISDPNDCCVYLVNDGENAVLIDTGIGSKKSTQVIYSNIKKIISPDKIHYILVTHSHIDHVGGLKTFKEKIPGAKIIAHSYAAKIIEKGDNIKSAAHWYQTKLHPVSIDITIEHDTEFNILREKFWVYHTPGHTPGSVIGLIELAGTKDKVLFGQDIHGPFMDEWGSDITQWRQSMDKILQLEPTILCEGHYGIISGESKTRKFIENYLKKFS